MWSKKDREADPRICTQCLHPKSLKDDFYEFTELRPERGGPKTYWMHECKKCYSQRKMDQYNKYKTTKPWHEEKRLSYLKNAHKTKRELVLDHYGKICVCCGETREKFLTIDHTEPLGSKAKRSELKHTAIYAFLFRENFPEGFRVLCWNCNCGRAINSGICPHEVERSSQARAEARSHECGETPEVRKDRDMVETALRGAAVQYSPWGLQ